MKKYIEVEKFNINSLVYSFISSYDSLSEEEKNSRRDLIKKSEIFVLLHPETQKIDFSSQRTYALINSVSEYTLLKDFITQTQETYNKQYKIWEN
jgi:hypothetical protein